jgi:hypothetical protein
VCRATAAARSLGREKPTSAQLAGFPSRQGMYVEHDVGRTLMREDIVPGAAFPDYELRDHLNRPCSLSELQGGDPMILTLLRGNY